MSVADAVYDYIDFLLDKKAFILRGPANMEPAPKKKDTTWTIPENVTYTRQREQSTGERLSSINRSRPCKLWPL